MNADGILNLLGSIVTVALVTTVLMRGTAFAQVINALGNFFTGSLKAAQGR